MIGNAVGLFIKNFRFIKDICLTTLFPLSQVHEVPPWKSSNFKVVTKFKFKHLFHYLLILFLDKDPLLECSYHAKITNLFFFQLHQPNYLICLTPLLKLHIIFTIHIFAVIHIRSATQPMVRLARF